MEGKLKNKSAAENCASVVHDRLWGLYLARVAKAETVNTMRRDGKAIFRDAFIEAKCAHEVWVDMTKGGNEK
jgi:hypothetical protein